MFLNDDETLDLNSLSNSILKDIALNKFKQLKVKMKEKDVMASISAFYDKKARSFKAALKKDGVSVIAEMKKASPSAGEIVSEYQPKKLAITYETGGADAISVLCEETFFHGHIDHLRMAYEATLGTPLLCKDFIINEWQIYEARLNGANAVLLIVSLLSDRDLFKFIRTARIMGMDALCEIHDDNDLKRALASGADIIGINNRNLKTFKIDMENTAKLAKKIPEDVVIVAESGVKTAKDVQQLPANVDAVLVGTSIMEAADKADKIRELKLLNDE